MNAIADCIKAIQYFTDSRAKIEIRDLKQLVDLTKRAVAHNPAYMNVEASNVTAHLLRVQPVLRVPLLTNSDVRHLT